MRKRPSYLSAQRGRFSRRKYLHALIDQQVKNCIIRRGYGAPKARLFGLLAFSKGEVARLLN